MSSLRIPPKPHEKSPSNARNDSERSDTISLPHRHKQGHRARTTQPSKPIAPPTSSEAHPATKSTPPSEGQGSIATHAPPAGSVKPQQKVAPPSTEAPPTTTSRRGKSLKSQSRTAQDVKEKLGKSGADGGKQRAASSELFQSLRKDNTFIVTDWRNITGDTTAEEELRRRKAMALAKANARHVLNAWKEHQDTAVDPHEHLVLNLTDNTTRGQAETRRPNPVRGNQRPFIEGKGQEVRTNTGERISFQWVERETEEKTAKKRSPKGPKAIEKLYQYKRMKEKHATNPAIISQSAPLWKNSQTNVVGDLESPRWKTAKIHGQNKADLEANAKSKVSPVRPVKEAFASPEQEMSGDVSAKVKDQSSPMTSSRVGFGQTQAKELKTPSPTRSHPKSILKNAEKSRNIRLSDESKMSEVARKIEEKEVLLSPPLVRPDTVTLNKGQISFDDGDYYEPFGGSHVSDGRQDDITQEKTTQSPVDVSASPNNNSLSQSDHAHNNQTGASQGSRKELGHSRDPAPVAEPTGSEGNRPRTEGAEAKEEERKNNMNNVTQEKPHPRENVHMSKQGLGEISVDDGVHSNDDQTSQTAPDKDGAGGSSKPDVAATTGQTSTQAGETSLAASSSCQAGDVALVKPEVLDRHIEVAAGNLTDNEKSKLVGNRFDKGVETTDGERKPQEGVNKNHTNVSSSSENNIKVGKKVKSEQQDSIQENNDILQRPVLKGSHDRHSQTSLKEKEKKGKREEDEGKVNETAEKREQEVEVKKGESERKGKETTVNKEKEKDGKKDEGQRKGKDVPGNIITSKSANNASTSGQENGGTVSTTSNASALVSPLPPPAQTLNKTPNKDGGGGPVQIAQNKSGSNSNCDVANSKNLTRHQETTPTLQPASKSHKREDISKVSHCSPQKLTPTRKTEPISEPSANNVKKGTLAGQSSLPGNAKLPTATTGSLNVESREQIAGKVKQTKTMGQQQQGQQQKHQQQHQRLSEQKQKHQKFPPQSQEHKQHQKQRKQDEQQNQQYYHKEQQKQKQQPKQASTPLAAKQGLSQTKPQKPAKLPDDKNRPTPATTIDEDKRGALATVEPPEIHNHSSANKNNGSEGEMAAQSALKEANQEPHGQAVERAASRDQQRQEPASNVTPGTTTISQVDIRGDLNTAQQSGQSATKTEESSTSQNALSGEKEGSIENLDGEVINKVSVSSSRKGDNVETNSQIKGGNKFELKSVAQRENGFNDVAGNVSNIEKSWKNQSLKSDTSALSQATKPEMTKPVLKVTNVLGQTDHIYPTHHNAFSDDDVYKRLKTETDDKTWTSLPGQKHAVVLSDLKKGQMSHRVSFSEVGHSSRSKNVMESPRPTSDSSGMVFSPRHPHDSFPAALAGAMMVKTSGQPNVNGSHYDSDDSWSLHAGEDDGIQFIEVEQDFYKVFGYNEETTAILLATKVYPVSDNSVAATQVHANESKSLVSKHSGYVSAGGNGHRTAEARGRAENSTRYFVRNGQTVKNNDSHYTLRVGKKQRVGYDVNSVNNLNNNNKNNSHNNNNNNNINKNNNKVETVVGHDTGSTDNSKRGVPTLEPVVMRGRKIVSIPRNNPLVIEPASKVQTEKVGQNSSAGLTSSGEDGALSRVTKGQGHLVQGVVLTDRGERGLGVTKTRADDKTGPASERQGYDYDTQPSPPRRRILSENDIHERCRSPPTFSRPLAGGGQAPTLFRTMPAPQQTHAKNNQGALQEAQLSSYHGNFKGRQIAGKQAGGSNNANPAMAPTRAVTEPLHPVYRDTPTSTSPRLKGQQVHEQRQVGQSPPRSNGTAETDPSSDSSRFGRTRQTGMTSAPKLVQPRTHFKATRVLDKLHRATDLEAAVPRLSTFPQQRHHQIQKPRKLEPLHHNPSVRRENQPFAYEFN